MDDRHRLYVLYMGAVGLAKYRALYDLIHCQVRWLHLAKVACWPKQIKPLAMPCALLWYTLLLAQGRSFISFGRWQNPPPLHPSQTTTNFATLTLPPSAIRKYMKLPLSQCEVRINSALLLSQLHIWVEIMASRVVVDELVAGEVPT